MSKHYELLEYYRNKIEKLIFFKKLTRTGNSYSVMYNYEFADELENFKKTFIQYFPYFVKNEDNLKILKVESDIEDKLQKISANARKKSPLVPQREFKKDGVYGELFLDFYQRVINDNNLLISYAGKRTFNSGYESTGYDNVLYKVRNDQIELIIAEAKFVSNISSTKSNLLIDILGSDDKSSHLTREYFNDYMYFIIDKNDVSHLDDNEVMRNFFNELNNKLLDGQENFIDVIIAKNIKVNLVLFSIYQDNRKNPDDINEYYDELTKEAKNQLVKMGIKNYSIKVVFIPTDQSSVSIKGEIDKFYG